MIRSRGMNLSPGRAAALAAVNGMLAALAGCAGAPRGAEAPPPLPEYPPSVDGQRAAPIPTAARSPTLHVAGERPASEKACCKGRNDCKGKGNCKTEDNDCKGKNQCKGKGGCKAADCS